jgi:hypothetical protein
LRGVAGVDQRVVGLGRSDHRIQITSQFMLLLQD